MQKDDGLKGTLFIRPKPTRETPFSQISANPDTLRVLERAANNALLFNAWVTLTWGMCDCQWLKQCCIGTTTTTTCLIGRCPSGNAQELSSFAQTIFWVSDRLVLFRSFSWLSGRQVNGKGQVACPNKAIVDPLTLELQKPITPKGWAIAADMPCYGAHAFFIKMHVAK